MSIEDAFLAVVIIIILLLGIPIQSGAQDYEYIQYTTEDGLPSNYVYGVVEDKEGYIWAYTENGLSKFDGYTFLNYSTQDGLPGNDISYAQTDNQGVIWLSIYQHEGAYVWKDSIILMHPVDSANYMLKGLHYNYAFYSGNGKYNYALTKDTAYAFFKDQIIQQHPILDSLFKKNPESFKGPGPTWPNGFIWLLHDGVLAWKHLNRSKLIFIGRPESKPINYLYKVKSAHLNGSNSFVFLIGLDELILVNFDTEEVNKIPLGQYKIYPKAHAEISTFQSTFIINTDVGFLEFDFEGNLLMKITLDQLRERYYLLRGFKDSKGNLWIGSRRGGLFFIPKQFLTTNSISLPNKAKNSFEHFLDLGNQQILCLTDNSGVYLYKDKHLEIIVPNGNSLFRSIVNTSLGIFIYDGINSKVLKNNNTQWWISSIQKEFKNAWISEEGQFTRYVGSELEDYRNRKSQVFIPERNQLFQAHPNHLELVQIQKSGKHIIQEFPIIAKILFYHKDQDILLGGNNTGLFLFKDTHFTSFLNKFPALKNIQTLAGDNDDLWIGTESGEIFHYQFLEQHLNKLQNIPGLRKIKLDSDSTLLAVSNMGVKVIPKYYSKTFSNTEYTTLDGLPSNDIRDVQRIGDSLLLVATFEGIHKIDRRLKKTIPLESQALILKTFKVNGLIYQLDSLPSFKYKQNNLELSFQLLDYGSDGKINYHYQLAPIEKEWSTGTDRSVRYPSLSPGKYTFHLKAENAFGQEIAHQPISFQIQAPFWERTWFIILSGLLLLISIIAFINYRDRIQRSKLAKEKRLNQKLTELELTALKAQMNPHFVFNALGSIQYFIQTQDVELADGYLAKFAKLMRMYLDSSKEKMIPLEQELKLLRTYTDLEKMRFEDHFKVDIEKAPEVDENDCYLPSMMIQPLIENAINHGLENRRDGKGLLEVIFKKEQHLLVCYIRDNGIGRANAAKLRNRGHRSRGLALIKEKIHTLQNSGIASINMHISDLYPNDPKFPGTQIQLVIENFEDNEDKHHYN